MFNMTTTKKAFFILSMIFLIVCFNRTSMSLCSDKTEGAVLHAWCWKFKDVSDNIDKIKEAGYVGVQVSPVQLEKKTVESPKVFSSWWAFYQPLNFKVGNSLGTEDEFRKMCSDARAKGIKIIVDIVANHLANERGIDKFTGVCDYSGDIDEELLALGDDLFHRMRGDAFASKNRLSYTQKSIGMPDLNTSNKKLQSIIIEFLNHLQDLGADGFRFDAARHIELPGKYEGVFGSDFWPNITKAILAKDPNCYIYGEILADEGVTNPYNYLQYMKVTENLFGINLCKAIRCSNPNLVERYSIPTNPEDLVVWVESHDTYAENGRGPTFDLTDEQLRIGWAVTASREGTVPLFLVRPSEDKLTRNAQEVLTGVIGGPGNPLWYNDTVVQINKFKQCMSGKPENIRVENDKLFEVERGEDGLVIVNFSDSEIEMKQNTSLKPGKYIDKVSHVPFFVHDGEIRGKISPKGVAILYDPEPDVFVSQEGHGFKGVLELMVRFENATDVYYVIDDGEELPLPLSKKIKVERDFKENESFSIRFVAKAHEKVTEKTYSFEKLSEKSVAKVKLRENLFDDPYIYFYSDCENFFRENAKWPGVRMVKLENGDYEYVIPDGWNAVKVIVSDHGQRQIPGPQQDGISLTLGQCLAISDDGSYMCTMG